MSLEGAGEDVLARAVDLLTPLAFGQRVLVRAAPRSGTSERKPTSELAAAASAPRPPLRVLRRLRRRRLVEQRGVGNLHAGQVRDHGLEIGRAHV